VPPRDTPPVQIVRGLEPGMVVPVSSRLPAGNGRPALDQDALHPLMPGVVGRSLRSALGTLEALDIQVEVIGRGVVVAQRPAAGEALAPGSVARLELAPPTARR
jgi:hypothetical protein